MPAKAGLTFCLSFFRPYGAWSFSPITHGLRRGLHAFAASRLERWRYSLSLRGLPCVGGRAVF
jgi:hypothetical protein